MNLTLFDLDHTLLPLDSDNSWGKFLVRMKVVDEQDYGSRSEDFYQQYVAGTFNPDDYLAFAFAMLAKFPRKQLDELRAQYIREIIKPAIRQEALDLIAKHRDAGDLLAIATSTNRYITEPIAQAFGITNLLAATPEEREDSNFTGKVAGIHSAGANKLIHVKNWLRGMGKTLQDFTCSTAYSDSDVDLPMLLAVTRPVATNPNDRLKAYAQKNGWPQLVIFND